MITKYGTAESQVAKTAEGRADAEKAAEALESATKRRARAETKPYTNKQKEQVANVP
jgi:hypothetical protein